MRNYFAMKGSNHGNIIRSQVLGIKLKKQIIENKVAMTSRTVLQYTVNKIITALTWIRPR